MSTSEKYFLRSIGLPSFSIFDIFYLIFIFLDKPVNMTFINHLSQIIGSEEDALRLLVAILACYPLAIIYRTFIYKLPERLQHWFFVVTGVLLYLFFCGLAIFHTIFSIIIAYLIVNFIPGTPLSVAAAHIFFLGHLLIGIWFVESSTYDITWTTPFCIVTLRMTALVMDVYDGHQKNIKTKPEQLKTAIMDKPNLLEIAAYSFFFSGTLTGPHFSLKRFREFVNGNYLDKEKNEVRESSIMASLQRFVCGVFFAVLYKWGTVWIPDSYFNSPEFLSLPLIWKIIWNTIWFKSTMYRYCVAWLLTEGSSILCGISYNGKDFNGDDKWNGTRNINVIKWELGSDFQSVIDSFNCSTNEFAKKFLYSFIAFGPPQIRHLINQKWARPFCWLFGRLNINISMAFAFLTFGLLKKEIWIVPLKSMYFYGYIIYFIIWPTFFAFILRPLIKKPKPQGIQELPNNAKKLIQVIWNNEGENDEILSSYSGVNITRRDFLNFFGNEWLNDEVINFYVNLIVDRSKNNKKLPKAYAFNSFFYKNLCEKGFSGVKRWTKNVDIFDFQIIIVPIHLENHWCMAVIDLEQHKIDYFDSLLGDNFQCLELLQEYLLQESMDKRHIPLDMTGWEFNCRKNIPRQQNMWDCGVFSCLFAEYASRRAAITFNQQHIPYFRERIVYEILRKELL
uniref:Lysophospholipid acyltransferase 5 n=1 Tax=Meloidogyne hapla TaxID=6305 RepID=A0A1I8BKA9_MELHA